MPNEQDMRAASARPAAAKDAKWESYGDVCDADGTASLDTLTTDNNQNEDAPPAPRSNATDAQLASRMHKNTQQASSSLADAANAAASVDAGDAVHGRANGDATSGPEDVASSNAASGSGGTLPGALGDKPVVAQMDDTYFLESLPKDNDESAKYRVPVEAQRIDLNLKVLCPHCQDPVPNLIEDFKQGDVICASCGTVFKDRIIDTRS